MNNPAEHARNPSGHPISQDMIEETPIIDLLDIFTRLGRGLGQIIGLAMLGTVIAVVGGLITRPWQSVSTSTRVLFSYSEFANGEYPDHSKFQPDDLRAPGIIVEALKRQGLDTSDEFQSQIRGALGIEGVFPPKSAKDYLTNEYIVTLTLPEKFPVSNDQRVRLLNEIISVYQENFQHTYTSSLAAFGHVFDVLPKADFPEYQQIFDREIDGITEYLTQQFEHGKLFRSSTTNLSFKDLLDQTQLFAQNRLSEPLDLIYRSGLSRDRTLAMAKKEYSLRILEDQERHAAADQKVFTDLLAQTQAQGYAAAANSKADQPHPGIPMLDQDFDSLPANETYSFLVYHALKAGLQVSQLQADKAELIEQLETIKAAKEDPGAMAQVQKSLNELEPAYQGLIDNIRKTQADFARQQYADAIRISDAVTTTNRMFRMLASTGAVGCFIGLAAGMGLSLLGIYIGSAKRS